MDLGLTQEEVAQRLGVPPSAISEWEEGHYGPSAGRWPAVLGFLGSDPYNEPESFVEALDAIRRRGWELQTLAQHLGISTSTMTRWQAGAMPWSRRARAAVAQLLSEHGLAGPGDCVSLRQPQTVAEHLLRRRAELRITQREAAERIGVGWGTYRGWETYGRPPRIQFWPGIISFLGYDPHPPPTSTAKRLGAARRVLGLPQRALAERLGVTQGAVQNWESGAGPKRSECRRAVAEFLDSVRWRAFEGA